MGAFQPTTRQQVKLRGLPVRWGGWLGRLVCLSAWLWMSSGPLDAATVTVDGSQTYQVIAGFGANINHRSWTNSELEPVLDALIDQAGMTIFRIIYDNSDWEATNDNSDPDVMNWTYYDQVYSSPEFEKLWGLSAYLNQKGITNGLIYNFQGYGPAWMLGPDGATLAPGYEDEWAEMIASLLIYARTNRQVQFGLVEPNNEPDFSGSVQGILMNGPAQCVTALHYLAQKLDTNGLGDVQFVSPDMAYTDTSWWTAIMNDPVVMNKVAHFGLHTYVQDGDDYDDGGQSDGIGAFLQQSAYPGADFWVTEFNVGCATCSGGGGNFADWEYFRGTAEYLLAQLANGATAGMVWEGYDSYYLSGASDDYFFLSTWGMFALNNPGTAPESYSPRQNFYTVAQISKYVRPGAQQIGVSGSLSPVVLLAFYQTNTGQLSLTGVNPGISSVDISGTLTNLPSVASFEMYYTDSSTNLCDDGTVWLTNGAFQVTVPADCVFTLTGSSAVIATVSVAITNPANGTAFNAPATIPIQASASTTAGTVSTVIFCNGTNQIGQSTTPPFGFVWTNVAPGAYVLSAVASNSIGTSGASAEVLVTVAGPPAQISVTPANVSVAPFGMCQFTALATDALGDALNPQPAFTWSVSGGGAIDTNGLFTTGGTIGGPYTIVAANSNLSGQANVTVAASSLVAAYGFEEGSGTTVNDASGNGNTGTISGGAVWSTGKFGGALSFDGASGAVTVPDSTSLDLSNGMTLEAWVFPLSVNRWNPIVLKSGEGGLDCYVYDASTSAGLPAMYCDGFGANVNGSTAVPTNSWSHVAATYDETNAILYVNGVQAVSVPNNTPITVSPGNLTIGFYTPSWFLGKIDEVRIYSRALSASGVLADMNTPVVPSVTNPPPPAVLSVNPVPDGIAITWAAGLSNYVLETTPQLVAPVIWSPLTNLPQVVNGQQGVVVSPAGGQQFFRLHQF